MTALDPLADVPIRDLAPNGAVIEERRTFRDLTDKARFLAWRAAHDARRADWFGVPALLRREGIATLEQAHAWVRDRVRYAHEPVEMLETPAYIARELAGDCDGQHTLVACMAAALGHSAALVPMGGTPEDADHLACMVRQGGGGRVLVARWLPHEVPPHELAGLRALGWTFAETTVCARFGELPIAAHRRLRGGRSDLG